MWKKFLVILAMLYAAASFAAVDVNKASAAQLDGIKGIGPAISGKIIDERKKGSYKDWQDFIDRVKGVGEKNAVSFSAEGLTVNGASFKGVAAAPTAKKDQKAAAKEEKKAEAKPTAAASAPAAAAAKEEKKDPKAEAKAQKEAEKKAKAEEKAKKAEEAKAKKEADKKAKEDSKKAKAESAKPAASAAKTAASAPKK